MDKTQKYYEGRKKIGHKKCALWFHSCEILEMEKLTIVAEKSSGFLVWCEGAGADYKRV